MLCKWEWVPSPTSIWTLDNVDACWPLLCIRLLTTVGDIKAVAQTCWDMLILELLLDFVSEQANKKSQTATRKRDGANEHYM